MTAVAIDETNNGQDPDVDGAVGGALERQRPNRLHLVEMATARALATVDSTPEHDRTWFRAIRIEALRTPFAGRLRVLLCASGLSAAEAAAAMNVTANHLAAMKGARASLEVHHLLALLREPRARALTVEMVEETARRFREAAADLDARAARRAGR